jgi:exonuclease III
MLGADFDNNFVCLPSVGASGGVLITWRAKLGRIVASRVDSFSVSVKFNPADGEAWWLTYVYGPQGHDRKIAFINELREIRVACAGPWLLGGDFNLIFRDEDKNNLNINRAMMGRFRRCINDLSIKDIDLLGRKYTWSGANNVQVRLDRVFCSSDWEEKFPNYLLQSSASEDSDHCPLLLGLKDNHTGK